ncbi:MAG: hypothetical protein KatS3mg109_0077 [Pirellulaceae bacterium]|nr:MAG: hypothetical protein KatS3mg109_0077 [Pirellulaceae bacterium]
MLREFLELAKPGDLYVAGLYWPDFRWDARIASALCSSRDYTRIYQAGRYWPDSRFTPSLLWSLLQDSPEESQRELQRFNAYMAGMSWVSRRWPEEASERFVKMAYPEHLYLAGRDWPDSSWVPAICGALVAAGDEYWIELAFKHWPLGRIALMREGQ